MSPAGPTDGEDLGGRARVAVTQPRPARAERLLVSHPRHRRGVAGAVDRERRARRARARCGSTPAPLAAVRDRRAASRRVAAGGGVLVVHVLTSVLDGFAPISLLDARDPVRLAVPAALAGSRRAGVRPADRAGGHEPDSPAAGLPDVAGDPLAGVRELAGRGAARARHGQRHQGLVDARAHRRVRRGRAGRGVARIAAADAAPSGSGRRRSRRRPARAPGGLMVFAVEGPLQRGWARRAGTPASLLGADAAAAGRCRRAARRRGATRRGRFRRPCSRHDLASRPCAGRRGRRSDAETSGGARGILRVRLVGAPSPAVACR